MFKIKGLNKKAEMGVGTLIIFIAMLLVAAVAAGVLIQTATSLQEKALSTGQQAKSQISTNARVIEVSGTDGRSGNITDFQEIIKLSPGSDPIKLDQIIFTFNTRDSTATLKYRGPGGVAEKNNQDGYNTWNVEVIDQAVNTTVNHYTLKEDLDDDMLDDYVYVDSTKTNITIVLSEAGTFIFPLGANLSNASGTPVVVNMAEQELANGTTRYAYISVSGTANQNSTLPAGSITVTPYKVGQGYFTAIYEQEGTNFIEGNLQRGDIVRLCFESPEEITEDDEVRLNFIPKIGTPTMTMFVTPDVMSTQRVYLYP